MIRLFTMSTMFCLFVCLCVCLLTCVSPFVHVSICMLWSAHYAGTERVVDGGIVGLSPVSVFGVVCRDGAAVPRPLWYCGCCVSNLFLILLDAHLHDAGETFIAFHRFWKASKPMSVMDFNRIKAEFLRLLRKKLQAESTGKNRETRSYSAAAGGPGAETAGDGESSTEADILLTN